MKTHQYPVDLTDEQIEEFGNELEAIRNEVFDSRGDRDRAYILKVIKTQRTMAVSSRFVIYLSLFFIPAWGHALATWPVHSPSWAWACSRSASPRFWKTWKSPTTCCMPSGTG